MNYRTHLLGLGLAIIAGPMFALPPPPPSPSAVAHDIHSDVERLVHPHHRHGHRHCLRRNHGGHCMRWSRKRR